MRARKVFAPFYKASPSLLLNDSNTSEVALPDITFHEFTTDYIIPEPQKSSKMQAKSNSPFSKPPNSSSYQHEQSKLRINQLALPKIRPRVIHEPKQLDNSRVMRLYREVAPELSYEKPVQYNQAPTKNFFQSLTVAKIYGLVPSNKKTSTSNTASPAKIQAVESTDFKAKKRKFSDNSSILRNHGPAIKSDHDTSIDSFLNYVVPSHQQLNTSSELPDGGKGSIDLSYSDPSAKLVLQLQDLRKSNRKGYAEIRFGKKRNNSAYTQQKRRLKTLLRQQHDHNDDNFDIKAVQPRKTAQFSLPPLKLKGLTDHETNDNSYSTLERNSSFTHTDNNNSRDKILLKTELSRENIRAGKEKTEETQRTARFLQPTSSGRKKTDMEKKASFKTLGQSTSRSRKETYREHILEGYRDSKKKLLYTHDRIGFQIEDQAKLGIRPRIPREVKNTIKINTELQNLLDKPTLEVVECDPNYDVKSDLVDTVIDDDTWKFFAIKHKEYANADYIKRKETYANLIQMSIKEDLNDVSNEFSKYLKLRAKVEEARRKIFSPNKRELYKQLINKT